MRIPYILVIVLICTTHSQCPPAFYTTNLTTGTLPLTKTSSNSPRTHSLPQYMHTHSNHPSSKPHRSPWPSPPSQPAKTTHSPTPSSTYTPRMWVGEGCRYTHTPRTRDGGYQSWPWCQDTTPNSSWVPPSYVPPLLRQRTRNRRQVTTAQDWPFKFQLRPHFQLIIIK